MRIGRESQPAFREGVMPMQLGTRLGILATMLAVLALVVGSAAVLRPGTLQVGPTGPQGPAGPGGGDGKNGTNGSNGTNGLNGGNGTNGTSGQNGTTWLPLWYGFDATFQFTGALTYLSVTELGCSDAGQGANYCTFNITNTCGPESPSGIQVEWACEDSYYALTNVSFAVNSWFCFSGSDPSLGYEIGWGQAVTVQLWFQTDIYGVYASGSTPPSAPELTPVIDLGFAEVST
jgi:hypothetical protein